MPVDRRRSRGLYAAVIAASLGTIAGVIGAASTGRLTDAGAVYAAMLDLRDAPLAGASGARSDLIASIAAADVPERFAAPAGSIGNRAGARPKLMIIFDDMGLDREAFAEVMSLPGPVTLSFLPYASNVQPLVDEARARGDDILLHLPMEPSGSADPGPHSLDADMSPDELFGQLSWNLNRFEGYVGVNNHMGSKFTRNEQSMKRVLSYIDSRGLLFVDSLTTGKSKAMAAGAAVGAEVYGRDVFLDPEPGRKIIQDQLELAERIALKTGYAIVIGHPRRDTLDVLGPWLTTAPARGFDLAGVSSVRAMNAERRIAKAAADPSSVR